MLVSLGVTLLLSFLAIKFSQQVKSNQSSKLVLFIQTLVESLYEFVQSITPNQAAKFFPLIATIFLFIVCANWVGLLPGVETIGILKQVSGEIKFVPLLRGGTADLNITLGLAIFAVISIQFFGYQAKGMKYFKKLFCCFISPSS